MGHQIKNFETDECTNKFAYLKKTEGQGNINVNLKTTVI